MVKSLIKSKLNALGDGLGDGTSNDLLNLFLNSLCWVGGDLKGLAIEKFGFEAEVVSAGTFATVGASEESLVSALTVLLVFVSSEAEGSG